MFKVLIAVEFGADTVFGKHLTVVFILDYL